MTSEKMRGFVQVYSQLTGMRDLKEALIQTAEGVEGGALAVLSNSVAVTLIFHLTNIASVDFKHSGGERRSLHLIFKNNGTLFVDKLCCRDAEKLKTFLNTVHQQPSGPPTTPAHRWSVVIRSRSREKCNQGPVPDVHDKPSRVSLSLRNGNGTLVLQEVPLSASKSLRLVDTGLVVNVSGKRKRTLSSAVEMQEVYIKENYPVLYLLLNKKPKTDAAKCVSGDGMKPSRLEDLEMCTQLEFGHPLNTSSTGNPDLDERVLSTQHLSANGNLTVPPVPSSAQEEPKYDVPQGWLASHPEKLWKGLPNLGNTCYMNAILQSLFAIPPFVNELLNQGIPWEKFPFDASILCFSQLLALNDLCNLETKAELLVSIKNSISAVAEVFSGNVENDAHEFLSQCLSQMKEDMEKLNVTCMAEREPGEDRHSQIFAASAFPKMFVCPVVANFEFELEHCIICKACGEVTFKIEMSNDLSINLSQSGRPEPLSLQYFLDGFFGAEEVEHSCEKCKHRGSVAVHKLSRLPRVLIIHTKRYIFNESCLLVKDNQRVEIPKYLSLTRHCDEYTSAPLPLDGQTPIEDSHILKVFQDMVSGSINSEAPPRNSTLGSENFLVPGIASDRDMELLECQNIFEGSGQRRHHGDPAEHRKQNLIDVGKVNSSGEATIEEVPTANLLIPQENTSLSVIGDLGGKLTNRPVTGPVLDPLQHMIESSGLRIHERTKAFGKVGSDSNTQSTADFYEAKEDKIPGGSQGMFVQLQQCDRTRIREVLQPQSFGKLEMLQQGPPQEQQKVEFHQKALPQSLEKPRVLLQKPPEDLEKLQVPQEVTFPSLRELELQENMDESISRSMELILQGMSPLSHRELSSDENPGNKVISGMEKTEAEVLGSKRNAENGKPHDPHAYRLIGIVSHVGASPKSGHYISDVYDFEQQAWFKYSDLQVWQLQEDKMRKARGRSGYIFFYMHQDIFKGLLRKDETSQSFKTESLEIQSLSTEFLDMILKDV